MKLLKQKVPHKSDKQIEEEITRILDGKDKSMRGRMLLKAAQTIILTGKSKQEVKAEFIAEYKKKYGALEQAKDKQKALTDLQKQSEAEIRQATGTKLSQ